MSETISRWQAAMRDVPGAPDPELMENITRVGEKGEQDRGRGPVQVFRKPINPSKPAVRTSGK